MKKILFSLLMLCCMTVAWAQEDGFVNVATTIQLWNAIKDNPRAKVRLTADFALSDINKDYELYCNGNTFYGTIDGNGHTIKGDPKADVRARTYMFSMTDGATIKNLTFKGIRVNSDDYSNQAIITSKAQNGCVFENITFENVHTWTNYDNAGSAAGWAENCTFRNITVRNSDFTVDDNQAGCVVGHAIGCTFTNIKVENCESTSAADFGTGGKSGGVAGRTDDCTISNVEILGSFIQTYSVYGGGVVGYAEGTQFTNCIVDDQSCVCVDGAGGDAYAGGIVGDDERCSISNCINSALIAADDNYAGGIIGYYYKADIEGCLNTGMVIAIKMDDVKNGFYNKYKTKTGMTCVTKTFQGKEYVIRKYDGEPLSHYYFGGIIGFMIDGKVSKCVNLGSVYNGKAEIGGILGTIQEGTISDCLSDFSGSADNHGICLFDSRTISHSPNSTSSIQLEVSINNCLNMTTYKDIAADVNNWNGFSGGNNYSLTTASDAKYTNKTTADKIRSGEICALLGAAWEQNIGIDAYPTPTGNGGLIFADNLDAEKYTYAETTSNVTIKRTFDTDGWYSLCLPFSLTAEQTAEKFAQVAEFSEIDGDTYKFNTVDVMEAGKAYIVKVDAKLENPKFTNVTIAANVKADESGAFVGVLKPTVIGDGCKVIGSGTTVNPANAGTMKAFRAYFPASSSANARYFSVDDSEITSVESIKEGTSDDAIYNMQGIRVAEAKRGLYIVNGKKVFVK